MSAGPAELRLHLERVLTAPPGRVFAACVEPEWLAQWWGPAGFTSPSIDLDVREGGRYRIAMQPPDGDLFHVRGEFREVDPPLRLVYTFEWEEPDDQETVVTESLDRLGPTPSTRSLQRRWHVRTGTSFSRCRSPRRLFLCRRAGLGSISLTAPYSSCQSIGGSKTSRSSSSQPE